MKDQNAWLSRSQKVEQYKSKLVTVRRLTAIASPNDDIAITAVDDWRVLVPKTGRFLEGTLVVFMEADTWLPAKSSFEKLFSRAGPQIELHGRQGYRVITQAHRFNNTTTIVI